MTKLNRKDADFIIVDEPMEGIDYGIMEQMLAAKLATPKGSMEFKPEYGEPVKDRYQEYADKHGITRAEAKGILFAKDYGGGMRNLKTELQRVLGVRGESNSKS